MPEEIYDLIVIGAGPGGYTAALRAAQLGMKTALVDRRGTPGGVCLHEGCIPSKALLESSELYSLARHQFSGHGIVLDKPALDLTRMMARKEDIVKKLGDGIAFLLKKNRIQYIQGNAKPAGARKDGLQVVAVTSPDAPAIPRLINGKKVLLAMGGRSVELPGLPFDGAVIVGSREALSFPEVPPRLLVVGGGAIGLELGSVWNRLGSRVTVVEELPSILPHADRQTADALYKTLLKQGMRFLFQARVESAEIRDGKAMAYVAWGEKVEKLECDRILVATGRTPETDGPGFSELGIRTDDKGRLLVDENFQTSAPGIYAIGDLLPGPLLAHRAMSEGTVFAERLAGQASLVEYEFLPLVTYTRPEVASVGKTEEQLKEEDIRYSVGRFPFSANGRARCLGDTDGFAKILSHGQTGRVLGVHIIGPRVSELISEAVTIMAYGGSVEDITLTPHPHPTLSEALRESALDAMTKNTRFS
jgi:dihydrolipoamide dehydrogenase